MSTMRSLKRSVAKARMKKMGVDHVNKKVSGNWQDLGAPDFVKRLETKYNNKGGSNNGKEESSKHAINPNK